MTWVRRADPPRHTCAPPCNCWPFGSPDGALDDLWRCDNPACRRLWRIGRACAACDATGGMPHRGQCRIGFEWRPATWWQRLRHRRR